MADGKQTSTSHRSTNTKTDSLEYSAKRLVILGILLQTLHVLFGFTAVMGMFINHVLIERTQNTPYHSQIRWQLTTFWVCVLLYAVAFWLWQQQGLLWPLGVVFVFAFYRVGTSVLYCLLERPLQRIF